LAPSEAHDHLNEEDLAEDNLHIVDEDDSFDDPSDGDRRDF
jgi:hypothetical protein